MPNSETPDRSEFQNNIERVLNPPSETPTPEEPTTSPIIPSRIPSSPPSPTAWKKLPLKGEIPVKGRRTF